MKIFASYQEVYSKNMSSFSFKEETEKLMNDDGTLPRRNPFEDRDDYKLIKIFIEESLKHEPKEWAERRKFDLSILKRLNIGYADTAVYEKLLHENKEELAQSALMKKNKPAFLNCVIIKVDDEYFIAKPKYKKNLFMSGTKRPWFVKGTSDVCYITEGETDAIRLHHIDKNCSTFSLGGVGNTKLLSELRKYFDGSKILIAFDNDIAGQEAIPKAIKELNNCYPVFKEIGVLKFDEKYKDIDEYFKNGGTAENISVINSSVIDIKKDSSNKEYQLQKQDEEIQNILKNGVSEGQRNISTFIVAKYFKSKKLPFDMTLDYIMKWNEKNNPPLDSAEVKNVVNSVYNYKGVPSDKKEVYAQKDKITSRNRPKIRIPEQDRLVSDFSEELGDVFKEKDVLFFKTDERATVEIDDIKVDDKKDETYLGFKVIQPDRFVSLSERFIAPYKVCTGQRGTFDVFTSMTTNHSKLVLSSKQFEDKLKKIKRIFTVPVPIIYENKLTFPKHGYDERFESWMPTNSIKINTNMPIEKAKEILYEIYNEFCFESEEDAVNAIAALITPFLRGLYRNFNERTPLFFYIANRERAGKDYCAGITGLLYDGFAIEEPPISSGDDFKSSHNEELRKKLMGVFMSGRKRLHFSNNRGFINNAVLEQIITSKRYSDRVLGRNEILTFDNELEISLSGNVGVTFTADLVNRCRFIRLKLNIEDPNKRNFRRPLLHDWVLKNRSIILSSIYTFVREWYNAGMPSDSIFTSFPEWARVCGGIMQYNNLGDSCKINKDILTVGGDIETESMKKLFEFMHEEKGEIPVTKQEMISAIYNNELQSAGIFHYINLQDRQGQTKFGMAVEKFTDRIFSGIMMVCVEKNKRSNKRQYIFKKVDESHANSLNKFVYFDKIKESQKNSPQELNAPENQENSRNQH
jgi:hypothetical protein